MRVLLAAVGTRGDVQPALALARELRKLGHAVRLCISPNFVGWAKSLGFEAVPMGVEMRMPARGATPKLTPEELRRLRESMPDLITDQFETLGAAAERGSNGSRSRWVFSALSSLSPVRRALAPVRRAFATWGQSPASRGR